MFRFPGTRNSVVALSSSFASHIAQQARCQSTDGSDQQQRPQPTRSQQNQHQQQRQHGHYNNNGGGNNRRYNNNNNQHQGGGGRYNNNNNNGGQQRYRNNNHHHNQQQQNIPAVVEAITVKPEDLPDDLKLLEAELTKKYGPLSQLQTRFDRRGQRFKAQATFRQCGFAVELATGVGATAIDAAKAVLVQALALDIMFLDPRIRVATASNLIAHTKGTFDELRTICTNAARMVKFSVVPNPPDENGQGGGGWAVRSFVRDDWEAISQLLPLVEVVHESANKALNDNAFQILETYRAEFSSPEIVKEDYLELCRHLKTFQNKTLSEMCTEDQSTRTYTVNIQVTDEHNNAYQVASKNNRQLQHAYSNAARSVFKIEMDQGPAHRPLLSQLRWQVDAMCLAVYGSTVVYREERMSASSSIHGQLVVDEPVTGVSGESNRHFRYSNNNNNSSAASIDSAEGRCADGENGVSSHIASAFSLYAGRVLAEGTGQGTYRIELKCYVTALKDLLREHPQVAADNKSLPFFRESDVEEALARHDNFDVTVSHRGKWNSFACLGTITSSLLGSYYESEFEEVPEGLHISTRSNLFINDGEQFARPLISRLAKEKADAWRAACCDAIRDNFPSQHEQLLKVDEYAASISKTEGMVSKHKSLSRDKRAPHFSNMISMLQSFAQEDFMWTQMQLIAVQNPKTQQWMGEIHVLDAGKSRCIYQSDAFPSAKIAKKVACYAVAHKHYPTETQIYIGLNRGDYMASDREFLEKIVSRTYDSRKPLTTQLCELIEKNQPHLKPVTWKLETMDETGRQRATVYSKNGTAPIADVAGEPLETAVSTLQKALLMACNETSTPNQKLMEEYMMTSPANVSSERDLASYLFVSFMGKLPSVSSVFVKPNWVQTLTIELDDGHRVLLHRSESDSKKEGTLHAYIQGAKQSFPQLLKNISQTPCDMREIAKAMLDRESGTQLTLDGRLVDDSQIVSGGGGGKQQAAGNMSSSSESATAPSESQKSSAASAPAATAQQQSNATKATAFLDKCMAKYDKEHTLITKLEVLSNGSTKATLTRTDAAQKKKFEVAGTGVGTTAAEALHNAAVAVLENLFDTHMALELERDPEMCDFPTAEE